MNVNRITLEASLQHTQAPVRERTSSRTIEAQTRKESEVHRAKVNMRQTHTHTKAHTHRESWFSIMSTSTHKKTRLQKAGAKSFSDTLERTTVRVDLYTGRVWLLTELHTHTHTQTRTSTH